MSIAVRVPEALYESAKRIAAFRGVPPSDVLAEAWREYLETHREELAADFEHAARLIREDDQEGLAEFANRSARSRAERAAKRARS